MQQYQVVDVIAAVIVIIADTAAATPVEVQDIGHLHHADLRAARRAGTISAEAAKPHHRARLTVKYAAKDLRRLGDVYAAVQ